MFRHIPASWPRCCYSESSLLGKWPKVLLRCLCPRGKPLTKTPSSLAHTLSPPALLKPLRWIKRQGLFVWGSRSVRWCLLSVCSTCSLNPCLAVLCVKTWNPGELALFCLVKCCYSESTGLSVTFSLAVVLIDHFDSGEFHIAYNSSLFLWWLFLNNILFMKLMTK